MDAFKYALVSGHTGLAKLLLPKMGGVDQQNTDLSTYLMDFVAVGNFSAVEWLLANGARVDMLNQKNITPLTKALYRGHFEIAELLIKNKADINQRNEKYKNTALIHMSQEGKLEAVNWLLKHGAKVHLKSKHGVDALYWAKVERHTEVEQVLKDHIKKNNTLSKIKNQFSNTKNLSSVSQNKSSEIQSQQSKGEELESFSD